MSDGGADLAQALQAQIADRALQYATPATIPYVQRSAYLADALSNISKTGGQNVRTPGALGSNLLAEALLRFAGGKANAALQGQAAGDQQRVAAMALAGLPSPDGSAGPQSPTSQGAPAASGGILSGLASLFGHGGSQPAPSPPPDASPQISGPQFPGSILASMAQDPPGAPQAVPGGAPPQLANGPSTSGPGPSSPLPAPAAPTPPSTPPLAALIADPARAFSSVVGQPVQITSSVRSPAHNAAVGGSPTSEHLAGNGNAWDMVVPGMSTAQLANQLRASGLPYDQIIDEGSHVHFGIGPRMRGQALVATGQGYAPMGPLPGQGAPQQSQAPQGAPQPQSIAQQPPASAQGAQLPGGYAAPPHGLAPTPDEWSRVQMLLRSGNPALMQQGQAMGAELQKRYLTPPAPDQPQWNGGAGQYQAQPGMGGQIIPGLSTPEAQVVYTPGSGKYESVRTPGAIVDNRRYNPTTGGFDAVPGLQTQTVGGFAPGTVVDRDPSGKTTVVQAPQYGAQQVQSVHDNFWGSDETKKAQEAYSAYTGLTGALRGSVGNNGIIDQAAMDSFLRGINPGMGARNSTVQMVADHFGLPQEIIGKIDSLQGKGFITPQILQQMVQTTHDYAVAHQQAAQARAAADAKMVAPYGYGPNDLAEDLPTIAPVPKINFGGGTPGPGVQSGNAAPVSHPSGIAGLFPGLAPQGRAAPAPTYDRNAIINEARRRGLIP